LTADASSFVLCTSARCRAGLFCGDFFTRPWRRRGIGRCLSPLPALKNRFFDDEISTVKQNCVLFYDNEVMKAKAM